MSRKNHIRPQLYFTKKERRAYYIIISLLISIYATGRLLPNHNHISEVSQSKIFSILSEWDKQEEREEPEQRLGSKHKKTNYTKRNEENESKLQSSKQEWKKQGLRTQERFNFDPNTITKDSLKQLGFSGKTSHIISKYRIKNGRFKSASDLKKIYGIDTNLVNSLKSHIKIKEIKNDSIDTYAKCTPLDFSNKKKTESKKLSTFKTVFIDINDADIYEWMQLRGIGERKAEIIVERRRKLGGFHSKEQLMNVWGISDSLYYSFEEQLVESSKYNMIPINIISQDSLAKHPYFTYKKAMMLNNYRRNHGPFRDLTDLEKIRPFNQVFLKKVEPYLDYRE